MSYLLKIAWDFRLLPLYKYSLSLNLHCGIYNLLSVFESLSIFLGKSNRSCFDRFFSHISFDENLFEFFSELLLMPSGFAFR